MSRADKTSRTDKMSRADKIMIACLFLISSITQASIVKPSDEMAYKQLQDIEVQKKQELNLDSEIGRLAERQNLYAERLQLRHVVKRVRKRETHSDDF